jgi:hypothetical protein
VTDQAPGERENAAWLSTAPDTGSSACIMLEQPQNAVRVAQFQVFDLSPDAG